MHADISDLACAERRRPCRNSADGPTNAEDGLIIDTAGLRSIVKKSLTGDSKRNNLPAIFE